MADFEAKVIARLDQSEFDAKMASLQSGNYTTTVKLNVGNLKSELANIQRQLKSLSNIPIGIGSVGSSGSRGGGSIVSGIAGEYKQLQSYLKQIGNLDIKVTGLDKLKNSGQITALANQYDVVKQRYDALMQSMQSKLTTDQWSGLASIAEQTGFRLDELKGKLDDAKAAIQKGISAEVSSGGTEAAIAAVEAQYKKLESTGHASLAAIKADLEQLNTLQSAMQDPAKSDRLVANYSQYEQVLARVKNQLKTVSSESVKMTTSLQATQMKSQMSTWLMNNSKAAANYGASIQGLISRVDQLNSSGQLTSAEAEKIKQEFLEIKMAAAAAGEVGMTFGDSISRAFKSILGVVDITQVIRTGIRYFKEMAKEVISVDSAMTQFKIVTDGTADDYSRFYKNTVQTAKNIGAGVTDLIDSSTTYARLGYSMDESSMLAKYTGMLQNVGDIDVGSASDAVTAITKAFDDVDASNIESAMDKMVEVGNNFPISVSQIAEGMTNAGSMLSSAGNSFEQSIALLTAANTTVQNISKASTGLRTLSARLRNTKTELDELGESMTDAEYENIVGALTNLKGKDGKGISLKDENGDLRNTYDIIKDISAVWDSMSKMDQAALAKTLAGTRQQNIFFGLVTQFKEAEGAMAAMQSSSGAMAEAYENVLDSVQGKINQFKASWTQLANTVLSSDFLKGAVDAGTTFIGILDKITGLLGPLPTLIGGIAAAMSFGKNGRGERIIQFQCGLYYATNMPRRSSNGDMNEAILLFA